ncbi:hypothetical protein C8R44DRAFT_887922 [Mycena epipterygia]|nr:hypothetical protein C8R44DRAFT_887922 [Mycena epipterygia]
MVLLNQENAYHDALPPRLTDASDTKQAVSQFLQLMDQLGLESEIPQEAQDLKELLAALERNSADVNSAKVPDLLADTDLSALRQELLESIPPEDKLDAGT